MKYIFFFTLYVVVFFLLLPYCVFGCVCGTLIHHLSLFHFSHFFFFGHPIELNVFFSFFFFHSFVIRFPKEPFN
ncbi:hypothetical protein STCU_11631 [Strigomonas culicis]|uniref:Uncharacterized protein n=1 Tax=Strigomonas culicis TaxID=28005 RepID=S9TGC5_9TRYP|nr:hypothetical protein STCU_11631 [Strigomonas culicis]|eukprot:EPY15979.1 hypothetical protein STCU_11631 [Strigomonas culicis]